MLGHLDLIDAGSCRQFLLQKTQHTVGGFGKTPGDPPDIYHSYLGLAALSILNDTDTEPFEPALCISRRAVSHLQSSTW